MNTNIKILKNIRLKNLLRFIMQKKYIKDNNNYYMTDEPEGIFPNFFGIKSKYKS